MKHFQELYVVYLEDVSQLGALGVHNEVLVNVIVKQEADGRTVAIVPGLPELQVEASDV